MQKSEENSIRKEKLFTAQEAAKYLGIHTGTLARWRAERNPNLLYVKVGAAVRYRLSDIEDFINRSVVHNEATAKEK